jgi:cytochrome c oxidase subunit II
MKAHTYEKAFLAVGAVMLVACAGALVYATVGHGVHLPGKHERLDPSRVYNTAPFNQPGVRHLGENRYEAVIVGQAWAFNPAELRFPVGAHVTFLVTSVDVLHGFHIERTRVNVMMIPGQVGRFVHTFREAGEHLLICHEFCGIAHHMMFGRVIVE